MSREFLLQQIKIYELALKLPQASDKTISDAFQKLVKAKEALAKLDAQEWGW